MQTAESVPPCLACGACCFSRSDAYVRVTGDDHARLGEHADDLAVFSGNRCYMRMTDGHCAALVIGPGAHYACRIYELRPEICRTLERGSPSCAAERSQKADRALLAQLPAPQSSETPPSQVSTLPVTNDASSLAK